MGKGMEIPREHRMMMRDTSRQSLTTFSEEGTSGVWFVFSYDNGSYSSGVCYQNQCILSLLRGGILWYTVVYYGILWYTVIYCDILWYTVIYCGIL